MSKWSDPDILAQLQELDKERLADKQSQFDAAMAEAIKNSRSPDPATAIPAQFMAVAVPVFDKLDQAARNNDIETIVKTVRGLAMSLAMMQIAATYRLPPYILDILDKLVERNMNQLHDAVEKHPKH